jgi:hypothetical protein
MEEREIVKALEQIDQRLSGQEKTLAIATGRIDTLATETGKMAAHVATQNGRMAKVEEALLEEKIVARERALWEVKRADMEAAKDKAVAETVTRFEDAQGASERRFRWAASIAFSACIVLLGVMVSVVASTMVP